ncbi:MAG: hypothetical protein IPQ06_07490 [Chitinophagaceae bacterium]|nr:hypothetical protein [Chitinophagaceae bacterium]
MKTILFVLVSFIAMTALLSGIIMVSDPGGKILNLSPDLLEGTSFSDFRIPGLLLAILVGGINLLAVFFNLMRHPTRYNWALAGGLVVSGWIIIQMILIGTYHWLHAFYGVIGILIILIAYQLKGKWVV